MRAGKADLPFPEPFNMLWKRISKITDTFHLRNHKREECHKKYNPAALKGIHPTYTGPEEAICEWSGQNFTQYSCTNERILLEIVTEASVCKAHSEMRSMSLLGGSDGMPPQENFEKLDTQICHFRVLYCKN